MAGTLTLRRLSNKDDQSWRDWPARRRSIADGAVHLGQKVIDPLLDKALGAFAFEAHPGVPDEKMLWVAVWYVVDDEQQIVAHLVATKDAWDGEPIVYVNQLWAPRLRPDLRKLAAEELDNWARARGCRTILMYTRRHSPKFWKATFGFDPYRVLYRRSVP